MINDVYNLFLKVVETGSISKAANELFISQPALSQQLKKLEKEFNAKLFTRSNKGIELTKEGKLITKKISGNGEITSEEENRIISTIKEFPEIYGYGDISKGHIFFLFDDSDFCPTKFKKTSNYGLLGSRLFDLKTDLEIENIEKLSTLEIAEKLNDITW